MEHNQLQGVLVLMVKIYKKQKSQKHTLEALKQKLAWAPFSNPLFPREHYSSCHFLEH